MRDLGATVLVAAIGVPYVGYLINGEMPFVKDPRGMTAVGLILGAAAFLVMRSGDAFDRLGKAETGLAVLPGYGGSRILLDGALTAGFDEVARRPGVDPHRGIPTHDPVRPYGCPPQRSLIRCRG